MTLWIAWSMLVSALIALAGFGIERIGVAFRWPRRGIWIGAMIAATAIPVALALRPQPAVIVSSAVETDASLPLADPTAASGADLISPAAPQIAPVDAGVILAAADQWIPFVWLLASVTGFASLAYALLRLRRDRTTWRPFETELGPVFVARDAGPAVVGVLRPGIVIPSWALDTDSSTRELLLRHEQEHLRAGDSRVLFGAAMLLALFPWNPALWYMARRLRLAMEIDCDTRVVRAVGRTRDYGLVLLTVGERYATELPVAACLSEPGSHLEARIHAMTTPRHRRPLLVSIPFAMLTIVAMTTAARAPRPTSLLPAKIVYSEVPVSAPVVVVAPSEAKPATPAVKRAESVATVAAVETPKLSRTDSSPLPEKREPKPLRGNPAPRYPDDLKAGGVDGLVIVQIAIDSAGIPDTTSLEVLRSTHDQFVAAVRTNFPRMRFDTGGTIRMAFRFLMSETARREANGELPIPTFAADGVSLGPVIITAAAGRGSYQETAARRMFNGWLESLNSKNAARMEAFTRRNAPELRMDQVVASQVGLQAETGGMDVLKIRNEQPLSLEFVVREKSTGLDHVGYIAVSPGDSARIVSLRMLLVNGGRTADDTALLEHLRAMRP